MPHHYQMTARYFKRPGDSQPAVHRFPENSPTFLGPVFDHFKHFFRLRTKIDWDDRVEKAGSRPAKDWQYRPPVSAPPSLPPPKKKRKFGQRIARRPIPGLAGSPRGTRDNTP